MDAGSSGEEAYRLLVSELRWEPLIVFRVGEGIPFSDCYRSFRTVVHDAKSDGQFAAMLASWRELWGDPHRGESSAVAHRAHARAQLPGRRRGALSSLRCTVRALAQCLIRVYKTWYSAVKILCDHRQDGNEVHRL